jgi:hypothetical protein
MSNSQNESLARTADLNSNISNTLAKRLRGAPVYGTDMSPYMTPSGYMHDHSTNDIPDRAPIDPHTNHPYGASKTSHYQHPGLLRTASQPQTQQEFEEMPYNTARPEYGAQDVQVWSH